MIEILKAALVDYLEAAAVPEADLAGCTVHDMDIIPDVKHHPAITVDWAEQLDIKRERASLGRVQITMDFQVTLYVSSTKGLRVAHQVLNNLVCRASEERYMGLAPLLSRLNDPVSRGVVSDSLGSSWSLELLEGNERGIIDVKNSSFCTVAIAFRVRAWTFAARDLY